MKNEYMSAREAAKKWGVSLRRVQRLIADGRIDGSKKFGHSWVLPADSEKPKDMRSEGKAPVLPPFFTLPRKCPVLIFTTLYSVPGSGESVAESLRDDRSAYTLFDSQLAYFRGETDRANALAKGLLDVSDRPDVRLGCLFVLALCAMYEGNVALWLRARRLIEEIPCNTPEETAQRDFQLGNIGSGIYDGNFFPEWFRTGEFDPLPPDCYPLARFLFLKWMMISSGDPSVSAVCGPLISQSRMEGALLSEIYCLIMTAIGFHDRGSRETAAALLDKAIKKALPDRLFSPFAEYRSEFGILMDARLEAADRAALIAVRELNKRLITGWAVLCREVRGIKYTENLTQRERHSAKLAAKGLTNAEIAARMGVSVNSVKRYISGVIGKTGAPNRDAIADYIALSGETLPQGAEKITRKT